MSKLGWQLIIGGIIVLSLFGSGFLAGYKSKHCPITTSDTILVHDTITRVITKDHYITHIDTIIKNNNIPAIVDTAFILHDYYDKHVYDRKWFDIIDGDTALKVNINDTISMNKPIGNLFTYQWLKPQTIVNNYTDNSTTYNKYLQFGLSMPVYKFTNDSTKLNALNKLSLKLDYIFPKGSIGVNWQPQGNVVGIEFSATLIKFKNKK